MSGLLDTLGLSAEAVADRRNCIGGSDANIIMSGDNDRILRLWQEKRGEARPEDLSDILAVQMGSYTEPLNRAWFEKHTGYRIEAIGEVMTALGRPWMRCTLDGRVVSGGTRLGVFEAKHVGVRQTDEQVFAKYVPQLTHNCICDGGDAAFLSAFKGNGDWMLMEYRLDDGYAAELIEREEDFWRCVQTGEPPCPLPPPPPPKPVGVVEYDMSGSNSWAASAADYLETVLAADRHETAKKALKDLVPADASKAFGHGITITRTKAGALRFAA